MINLEFLKKGLIGQSVRRPLSGTLSGHAAGEPFGKLAHAKIKERYPGKTYYQYEYLNWLYRANPKSTTAKERLALIPNAALAGLLNRGKAKTLAWSPKSVFEEKQNDTADTIVIEKGYLHLIDIKTFNTAKDGQPPNIISAYKLAKMCILMLKEKTFSAHDIIYVGISWKLKGARLICTDVAIKALFKANPATLYINWSAALQIQFHVERLDQSYSKSVEDWCREYLQMFVTQAKNRREKMEAKFEKPFQLP